MRYNDNEYTLRERAVVKEDADGLVEIGWEEMLMVAPAGWPAMPVPVDRDAFDARENFLEVMEQVKPFSADRPVPMQDSDWVLTELADAAHRPGRRIPMQNSTLLLIVDADDDFVPEWTL